MRPWQEWLTVWLGLSDELGTVFPDRVCGWFGHRVLDCLGLDGLLDSERPVCCDYGYNAHPHWGEPNPFRGAQMRLRGKEGARCAAGFEEACHVRTGG